MDKEKVLWEVWEERRKELGFLPLKMPKFGKVETACIDMKNKEIVIGENFVEMLYETGLSYRDSLGALINHEGGHYRYHPYDVATILEELNALKSYDEGKFGGGKAEHLRACFDDVVDNLYLIFNHNDHDLEKLYRAWGTIGKTAEIDKLLRAYYKEISDLDFGVDARDLSDDLKARLETLKKIDFMNREKITLNIRKFAGVVNDLIDQYTGPFDIGLGSFSEEDIKKGLREIAERVSPEEFKEIYKYIEGSEGEEGDVYKKADIEYYKSLALQYPIKLLGMPLVATDSTYPARLKEWEVGDELRKINPYRSFGKIIPGITKRWIEERSETYGDRKDIPDSIIVLDSSGSMIDPTSQKSPAVIGAFSVALAYIMNNKGVDVINFSTSSYVKPWENEQSLFETLAIYQGGGTNPPHEELKKLVEKNKKDATIITDGFEGAGSEDIRRFMEVLSDIGKKNRVSFIYIGSDDASYRKLTKYDRILFHQVKENEDIASIILGDIRW